MKAVFLRRLAVVPSIVLAVQALAPAAGASHSWNGYHWARSTSSFTLDLTDNLSGPWQPYLSTASKNWTKSTVLNTAIVAGTAGDSRCAPVAGLVKVCNATYGSNGWLGLGSVWTDGSHITKGTVKMNDSYFKTARYNTTPWRNLVMCQEMGHTLGLDHQDENSDNANLGTCMDYTNDPSTNQHPNQHDYDELVAIYSHRDAFTTVRVAGASPAGLAADTSDELGTPIRHTRSGRPIVFELDSGGTSKFTFVTWAE
ncbi:MAG: hypothetical protein ACR2LJ_04405 [Acidimicrobiales bacterium]